MLQGEVNIGPSSGFGSQGSGFTSLTGAWGGRGRVNIRGLSRDYYGDPHPHAPLSTSRLFDFIESPIPN